MLRAMRNQTVFVNRVWNAPVMRSFHASVVSLAEGKAPKAPAVKDEVNECNKSISEFLLQQ